MRLELFSKDRTACLLMVSGWLTLIAGATFYWVARDSWTLLEGLPEPPKLAEVVVASIPSLCGSAPSGLHALSFSLISGSVARKSRTSIASVCVMWACINVASEFMQTDIFAQVLDRWWGDEDYLSAIKSFVTNGTFDLSDIVAALAGSGLAYVILSRLVLGAANDE